MLLHKAGSYSKGTETLIEEDRSPRLLSYLNDRKAILRRVEMGLQTFVDSGAYSAYTKGAVIDVDAYIDFVNTYDAGISVFAQLDVIPGKAGEPKTEEQMREAPIRSWKNYLYMRERVISVDKLLPTFHIGEDFKYLVQMLEFTPKIAYIGLGGMVGNFSSVEEWLDTVFRIIKSSSNPNVKIHGFGMTSLKILKLYPFYSCDSTSWLMISANGGIMTEFGTVFTSDGHIGNSKHMKNMGPEFMDQLARYVGEKGYTLEQLATDYIARGRWNITYLTDWQNAYRYEPKKIQQSKLF